jgi:hypothetical protein
MRASMRCAALVACGVALLASLTSCTPAASPDAAAGDRAKVIDVKLAPDAFKVDKVGGGDGSVDPNGVPDAVFTATIEGPVLGLILVAKDAHDAPIAQWDTLTGKDTLPTGAGLYSTHGDSTAGIVVYEGDVRLTRTDGSLPPLAAGPHTLVLYVEIRDVPQMKTVELLLQRSNGTIARGVTMPLTLPVTPPS